MQALVCPYLGQCQEVMFEKGSNCVGTDGSLILIKVANVTCYMSDASAYSVTIRSIRPYTTAGPQACSSTAAATCPGRIQSPQERGGWETF
jgi:hypothetical protein